MIRTLATEVQASPVLADEWLTPKEVKIRYKIGNTRFWQLVRDGAFPVSRPKSPNGRDSRLIRIRRSDVDAFMNSGYPAL